MEVNDEEEVEVEQRRCARAEEIGSASDRVKLNFGVGPSQPAQSGSPDSVFCEPEPQTGVSFVEMRVMQGGRGWYNGTSGLLGDPSWANETMISLRLWLSWLAAELFPTVDDNEHYHLPYVCTSRWLT